MIEDLDPVVRPIAHEHPPSSIDGDSVQRPKLTRRVPGRAPRLDERAVRRVLHHAVVPIEGMAIRDENVPVVSHDDVGRSVEAVRTLSRSSGCAEGHQHPPIRAELDDLVASCSIWGSRGADGVGHPDVAVLVHIDPVGPYEHPAPEALYDVAVQIELEDRVQIRIQALVAEPRGVGCVTSHHCPDMVTVGVDRHPTHRSHFPPAR